MTTVPPRFWTTSVFATFQATVTAGTTIPPATNAPAPGGSGNEDRESIGLQDPQRTRTLFPETWLWADDMTG